MLRTHSFACSLPKSEADALNRESGRIYTDTLVWHYRAFRRSGHWLSQYAAMRYSDYRTDTTLHAHSKDAAQEAFYKACKVAKVNRGMGAKYPHKRKFYRTTTWKSTGIRVKDGRLLLARARGLEPVTVTLPETFAHLPKTAFVEARLVYDQGGKRYNWHFVIEDGTLPNQPTGDKTLAIDLGEIHPAAIANERGEVVIVSCRELRAVNQYRHKRLSTLQARQAKCQKRSRLWKRLQHRKAQLLAKNKRQVRDIEHKVTRAVVKVAVEQQASTVYVGDLRDIGDGKRLKRNQQQKVSGWSHGRQIRYLDYKLQAEGITLKDHSEAYTSKTCPMCGKHNKADGRTYRCSGCGFSCHRDANGACNFESLVLFGEFGHVRPTSVMYRHPFVRGRSSPDTAHVAWGRCRATQEAAGL